MEKDSQEPITVKIAKAAGMLDVCTRSIRRLIDRREIQAIKCGRSVLVLVSSLHDYVRRHLPPPPQLM